MSAGSIHPETAVEDCNAGQKDSELPGFRISDPVHYGSHALPMPALKDKFILPQPESSVFQKKMVDNEK